MAKEKPYVEKIEDIGPYEVWLVDGEFVRKNINENFVGYDFHYHIPAIPTKEFWIDKSTNPAEHFFFVENLMNEVWGIKNGLSPEEANKRADLLEKRERAKFDHLAGKSAKNESNAELIEQIHKKLLKQFSDAVNIWLVDGTLIRDNFLVEYMEGGHDRVYSFIPKNEIWIEDGLSDKEIKFIVLHELHERFLMGEGKDYKHAHRGATEVEDYYRDHPAEIDERIKEEIKKNKDQANPGK